jgi:hypothetical protein
MSSVFTVAKSTEMTQKRRRILDLTPSLFGRMFTAMLVDKVEIQIRSGRIKFGFNSYGVWPTPARQD